MEHGGDIRHDRRHRRLLLDYRSERDYLVHGHADFLSFSIHIVCELRFSVCEKASERLFRALADIEIICVGIDIALEQERALLRIVYRFNEFVVPFGVVDRRDKLVLCAYAAPFELLRRLNDSRALGKGQPDRLRRGSGLEAVNQRARAKAQRENKNQQSGNIFFENASFILNASSFGEKL